MQRYRQFDAQVRFVLSAKLKNRLYREAARRRMSTADLLREYIESGLDPAASRLGVALRLSGAPARTVSGASWAAFGGCGLLDAGLGASGRQRPLERRSRGI